MLLAVAGCKAMSPASSSKGTEKRLFGSDGTKEFTQTQVQLGVERFADRYWSKVAEAADELRDNATTPEARAAAQGWRVSQCTGVIIDATGPLPIVNVMNMVVLATLSRMVAEDHWVGGTYGDSARRLLETHHPLEQEAWELAAVVLTEAQRQELRDTINEWRAENPQQRDVALVQLSDLEKVAAAAKAPTTGSIGSISIFTLPFLNPLAGLDPATQSIEQTRELAGRMTFYVQRLPTLMRWQVELLSYQVTLQPELRNLLGDADRLAKVAQELPQVINQQRKAAIDQVFDEMEARETKAREFIGELRLTLDAGSVAVSNVNDAIKSLDAFVARCQQPAPATATPSEPSKPFDIDDYTKALAQAAATARELNTLVASLDRSVPQASELSKSAEASGQRLLNRAFVLGLCLIAVLVGGLMLVA
jgi:hypothetical protein